MSEEHPNTQPLTGDAFDIILFHDISKALSDIEKEVVHYGRKGHPVHMYPQSGPGGSLDENRKELNRYLLRKNAKWFVLKRIEAIRPSQGCMPPKKEFIFLIKEGELPKNINPKDYFWRDHGEFHEVPETIKDVIETIETGLEETAAGSQNRRPCPVCGLFSGHSPTCSFGSYEFIFGRANHPSSRRFFISKIC